MAQYSTVLSVKVVVIGPWSGAMGVKGSGVVLEWNAWKGRRIDPPAGPFRPMVAPPPRCDADEIQLDWPWGQGD